MTSRWMALTARVTALTTPSSTAQLRSALELYRRIWREDPENFQKSNNPLVPSQAQGKRGGFTVSCSVAAHRVDFSFAPPSSDDSAAIENTRGVHDELQRIAEEIEQEPYAESVSRVAVFVNFFKLAPTIQEANRAVMEVIPERYRIVLQDEVDFSLQLNRPQQSRSEPNLRMNPLIKWSVDQIQVMAMSMSVAAQVAPQAAPTAQIRSFLGASVSFDFNNAASGTPLSPKQQSSLLLEELELIRERQREFGLNVEGF